MRHAEVQARQVVPVLGEAGVEEDLESLTEGVGEVRLVRLVPGVPLRSDSAHLFGGGVALEAPASDGGIGLGDGLDLGPLLVGEVLLVDVAFFVLTLGVEGQALAGEGSHRSGCRGVGEYAEQTGDGVAPPVLDVLLSLDATARFDVAVSVHDGRQLFLNLGASEVVPRVEQHGLVEIELLLEIR